MNMTSETYELTFRPDVPIHPGEQIRDMLVERGISQSELARRMKRPVQVVNEIINGKRSITAETAIQLEVVLGVSAETWMNLESHYQLDLVRQKKQTMNSSEYVFARFVEDFFKRPLGERNEGWDEFRERVEHFGNFWDVYALAVDYIIKSHGEPEARAEDAANWSAVDAFVYIYRSYSLVNR